MLMRWLDVANTYRMYRVTNHDFGVGERSRRHSTEEAERIIEHDAEDRG